MGGAEKGVRSHGAIARRPRAGLSLIETLFAGLIFCIVFFVLMSLYPTSLMSLRRGRRMMDAANLAQQLVEEKRLERWDTLAGGRRRETRNGVVYDAAIDVSAATDNSGRSDERVKRIAVTVTWDTGRPLPAGGSQKASIQYETRFYGFTNP